jgi:hypothetical protein
VALARRGAAVAGLDIAGPVSPILDFAPATPDDLKATGERVREAGGRWLPVTADQRGGGRIIITSSTQGSTGRYSARRIRRPSGG